MLRREKRVSLSGSEPRVASMQRDRGEILSASEILAEQKRAPMSNNNKLPPILNLRISLVRVSDLTLASCSERNARSSILAATNHSAQISTAAL